MDRFAWTDGLLGGEENLVHEQTGVRIYDGDQKSTPFDHGKAVLTTHRIIWRDYKDQKSVICVSLSMIVFAEEQSGSLTKSAKIVIHLKSSPAYKAPGPVQSSPNACSFIRLSFKEGGQKEFFHHLNETLGQKRWEQSVAPSGGVSGSTTHLQTREFRTGIGGIQKKLEKKNKETDQNISQAFEDLNKLMEKTVRFKSYLLSLGIDDPVTRGTHGTGHKYYGELAKQLSDILQTPLKECGGIMTLTDVYCRVNRARGMELLSPEDLINACKLMETLNLPVRLRVFESGVMVLQLVSHSEEQVIEETKRMIEDKGCITAEQLSQIVGLSVVLAKERLLAAERAGKTCRDEDTEGLCFYPNLFLSKT
ncbi:hypothetical protein LSH36_38g03056 [Paralvinella palmiformis]|uniref:Vacuolar protein-sorting-associated protein 36 n=1 Tax=Paralvinella palmiformis TaxID=53620 RepID=A0AAD9K7T7_9ANNE|nr:hypothetical protein LSH36_38g03056 [Paralvinella palmiformis]